MSNRCAAAIILLVLPACSPAPTQRPSATASASPTSQANVSATPSFETYADADYGFAFDYPTHVEIRIQEKAPFQVVVYTDPDNPFYVRATRDFLPGDAMYFLDTSPTEELEFGAYVWRAYSLPNGYADATRVSPPIFALQMQTGDVLHTVVFYNQDSLTQEQVWIMSTFRRVE